ncbi:hypothetical protein M2405_004015 [Rhodococcus erythropolis]|nr:hypothetical protein [Rhodococcus erythropolis]MCW2425226.1 hypothetical protein [Rhodococcus erythropolis]
MSGEHGHTDVDVLNIQHVIISRTQHAKDDRPPHIDGACATQGLTGEHSTRNAIDEIRERAAHVLDYTPRLDHRRIQQFRDVRVKCRTRSTEQCVRPAGSAQRTNQDDLPARLASWGQRLWNEGSLYAAVTWISD